MKKVLRIVISVLVILTCIGGTLCLSIIHSGELVELRNMWIETAMNTFHHKWLATTLFPEDVINEVMGNKAETVKSTPSPTSTPEPQKSKSIIFNDYIGLSKGDVDFTGNSVYEVNMEQEIAIMDVSGQDYKGKIAVIEDPSRVCVAHTSQKGVIGNNILTFLSRNNAILAVNASGFADYNGVGDGGEIVGASCASGEIWGTYTEDYNTIAFDYDNKLQIGVFGYWKENNIRDAVQFNPALILNGEKQVEGSAGWGISPRTAIGQRSDGAVVILTIDGRKPGYSIGATMEQCADEMLKYGVVNAAACDGGSSTIMGYKGQIITRCSSPQEGGRYLPNAFIVKKK